MAARRRQFTIDVNLQLQDAAAITASEVGQVGGSDQILDMGGGDQTDPPYFFGDVVFDISAIEIDSSDEVYTVIAEGSNSATFASGIEELARITFGDNVVITGGTDVDTDVGRYTLSIANERNGRIYRYLRLNNIVAGTVVTGITYTAYLAKRIDN